MMVRILGWRVAISKGKSGLSFESRERSEMCRLSPG